MAFLFNYLNYAPYLPVFEPYFYAMRVKCRACQQVFYNPPGSFTRALIFFKDDINFQAGIYVASVSSVHIFFITPIVDCDYTD